VLAAVEGGFTGLVVSFLMKARPEMLRLPVMAAELVGSASATNPPLNRGAGQEL
jgi:hypothetical protein